jgi:myo-inositol 2-dehydrogenase/D-chiro-inositol 1-dehydrogenase
MEGFIDLLRHGTEPLAGMREGVEAQRLAEAALASMRSGAPVHLDDGRWVPDAV